jgi:hypothetical protein
MRESRLGAPHWEHDSGLRRQLQVLLQVLGACIAGIEVCLLFPMRQLGPYCDFSCTLNDGWFPEE